MNIKKSKTETLFYGDGRSKSSIAVIKEGCRTIVYDLGFFNGLKGPKTVRLAILKTRPKFSTARFKTIMRANNKGIPPPTVPEVIRYFLRNRDQERILYLFFMNNPGISVTEKKMEIRFRKLGSQLEQRVRNCKKQKQDDFAQRIVRTRTAKPSFICSSYLLK